MGGAIMTRYFCMCSAVSLLIIIPVSLNMSWCTLRMIRHQSFDTSHNTAQITTHRYTYKSITKRLNGRRQVKNRTGYQNTDITSSFIWRLLLDQYCHTSTRGKILWKQLSTRTDIKMFLSYLFIRNKWVIQWNGEDTSNIWRSLWLSQEINIVPQFSLSFTRIWWTNWVRGSH